jgi:vacuolar-type H+-ATPase subunit E/Vma4
VNETALKNDPAGLIETLRRNVRSKIDGINSDADAEIKRIEDQVRDEIENFRAAEQAKSEKIIQYEEGKAANLLSIELKKQNLEVINGFINSVLTGASEIIRSDRRYADFLKQCATAPLKDITGRSMTICISPRDAEFSEMIMNEASKKCSNIKIRIIQDEGIITGGALVIDDEPEVVFNNTVERIFYRKSDELKRVIMRLVNEYADGVESR